jgi:PAS domain S-box-containing protein
MRIKTLYFLGAVGTALAVAVLETFAYDAFQLEQQALNINSQTDRISKGIYQLESLTSDYLLTFSERSVSQWNTRHKSLGLLIVPLPESPNELAQHLNTLAYYHHKSGELFDLLLSSRNDTADRNPATRTAALSSQLRTMVDAMASEADNVSTKNHQNMAAAWKRLRVVDFAVNLVSACLLTFFGIFGWFRVLRPLLELRGTIQEFALGKQEVRFPLSANDEINDVKISFNRMADSLCDTMVSRDLLSIEVLERKELEHDLRSSEAEIRSILDNMSDVFYKTDHDGNVIIISKSISSVLGYAQEEVLGKKATEYHFDPDGRQRMLAAIAANGTGVIDFELRMRHKQGHPVWVSASSHLVFDEIGQTIGIEGVFRSIEERKSIEKALRNHASEIESLFNASSDATMLFKLDGTLLATNNILAARFGKKPEDLRGTCLWDLFPPDVSTARRAAVTRVIEAGEPVHYVDQRGDLHFDNSIYPIVGEDGIIDKVAVYSRDVTEQKQVQQRIAAYVAEIERSNAELEQFAYVASHDLREPLRMISSYLSLLERRYGDRLDGDGLEFIGFARDGAKRMDHLVLDLLDLSRIERRGEPIVPTPIMPTVQLALSNLEIMIKDCGATITTDDVIQSSLVLGDSTQIMRLFQNLIGNSLKYRKPDTAPVIQIGGQRLDGCWQFSVGDNGIGIAPEYFERVFGIFQRLHTRDQYDGTGIGLAVCKKIVERHSGRIWVESIPGEGTTLHFTLPCALCPGE